MKDPSTETWRAALGQSTSAQLRQTQAALHASQQDLTAMQAERDAIAVLNAELKAEAKEWRATAEQYLSQRDDALHDLAHARFRLTTTEARLASLRETFDLAESHRGAVADRDTGITCSSCTGPIVRGQAFQPLADAKGFFAHVACPTKEK